MTPGESSDGIALTSEGHFDCAEIIVCQGCGHELTVGHYSDGTYCPGCRQALGPEPEEPRDSWAESGE